MACKMVRGSWRSDDFGDENDDDEDDVSLEEEEFNYELYENVMVAVIKKLTSNRMTP